MRCVGVAELPEPRMCRGGCAYEVKFHGRSVPGLRQAGRGLAPEPPLKGLDFRYPTLPADVVAAVRETLPPGTVVDGELVIFDTEAGSTVFPALLSRITAGRRLAREAAARPANLVLFDVLADAGDDLTGLPVGERRTGRCQLRRGGVTSPPTWGGVGGRA